MDSFYWENQFCHTLPYQKLEFPAAISVGKQMQEEWQFLHASTWTSGGSSQNFVKVIDRRIFEISASPEYFSKPKQAFWGSWNRYGDVLQKIHRRIFLWTLPSKSQLSQKPCFSSKKFSGEAVISNILLSLTITLIFFR